MGKVIGKVVGIDLGTTNSVVAIMEGGRPYVIANSEGHRTTPSVVAYTKTKDCIVGRMAKRQAIANPANTFYSVKRFIGRRYSEVKVERDQVCFQAIDSRDNLIKLNCPVIRKEFSPEEISAQILSKLVEDASKYIGEPVTQAVITVPAYFNELQRQSTIAAGRLAGLNVLKIINEPTAASLAYSVKKGTKETVLVFDLGGGTFDVSILRTGDGEFNVLATTGDTHLGGDDFDRKIVNWLVQEFRREEGVDLSRNLEAKRRLIEAAENAKIDLSTAQEVEISLPFIAQVGTTSKSLEKVLTRSKFDSLCADLIQRCRIPVEAALEYAGLSAKQIDRVVLAGGATRIPAIQKLVCGLLGQEPSQAVNPDEVVALGAAIQAGILSGELNFRILDVTALSLGISTDGGKMTVLIPKNTKLPAKRTRVISTAKDNQTSAPIRVYQGENERVENNTFLHEFRLDGIPPAPRGVPKIQVTYEIDENGTLKVLAENKDTGHCRLVDIRLLQVIEDLRLTVKDFPPQLRHQAEEVLNDINSEVMKPDNSSDQLKNWKDRLYKIFNLADAAVDILEFLFSLVDGE
ncbi:MAG: molecular chaperone DnaK [Oscillatoriaceae cyanobacterium Prado104]|jgi:molecular chaperone DnaK|nr:molecular chaperone DnaK [Oscillatoriaceae cyanobacterium Prado104]